VTYGISAGAIIMRDARILLVHHRRAGEFNFWVTPGGSLEGAEPIFECARRETFEETGLRVEPQRIVYVQELIDNDVHFCKFFILCHSLGGRLTLANRHAGEEFVVDARFFSQSEIQSVVAYPEVLRDEFWTDLATGFPQTRYIGLKTIAR
jgi:ADP-ribose pyrophosphatase YjhB (NUDIX family)